MNNYGKIILKNLHAYHDVFATSIVTKIETYIDIMIYDNIVV